MKRFLVVCGALACLCGNSLHAAERAPLEVIHDGTHTVPAAPYYQQIEIKTADLETAAEDARQQLATLEPINESISPRSYFPIRSAHLSLGPPKQKIVDQLPIPLFIIGMDRTSLAWFETHVEELKSIGARGVVVQADSYDQFAHLQHRAVNEGVLVSVTPGDAIAQLYGISTYPMLIKGR